MDHHPWVREFGAAVTVCDAAGLIIEMNDRAARMFRDRGGRALLGADVLDCHPEPARARLSSLMTSRRTSTYTTEKDGRRKLIHQAPWYRDGVYAGFVEIVLALPDLLPHFVRAGSTAATVEVPADRQREEGAVEEQRDEAVEPTDSIDQQRRLR